MSGVTHQVNLWDVHPREDEAVLTKLISGGPVIHKYHRMHVGSIPKILATVRSRSSVIHCSNDDLDSGL